MQEWQFFEWRRVLLAHTDTLLLSNLCEQQQQAVLAPGCSSCSRSAPWGVVQLLARPPSRDPCSCWSAATQHSRRTARKHSGDLGAIIMETKYVQVTNNPLHPIHPSSNHLTPLCNFTCSDTSTRDQWQVCNLCHPAQLSSQPWYLECVQLMRWRPVQGSVDPSLQLFTVYSFVCPYVLMKDYTFKQWHDPRLLTNAKRWHKPIKTGAYELLRLWTTSHSSHWHLANCLYISCQK